MPWKDQNSNGNNGGPWGKRESPGGRAPDIEEMLRRGQKKLNKLLPGGKGGIFSIFLVVIVLWIASGFYRVNADEQGVVLRFGEWVRTTAPGLHYHLPYPIEEALTPGVTRVNRISIGFREPIGFASDDSLRQVPEEALMLTGDENIVDINFTVFWLIKDAGKFLFNVRNQEITIKSLAESAMRDSIGRTPLEKVLTEGREVIESTTKTLLQSVLDGYEAGIEISQVQLQKVDPPEQVIDSFRDVQRAKADQEKIRNQAEAYRNALIPKARGEAEKIIQEAEGYKREVVARSTGDAERFLSVYNSYKLAKDVTVKRIYLETLEEVLKNANKIIIDESAGTGVVPYLPLPEIQKRQGASEMDLSPDEESTEQENSAIQEEKKQ
ncbi:MAG TPA: FtsH protease activity modulator HflK [Alphaproteobacteria bacterium]|nr:FtsH protease activity modulator HflK [Alphaproteobacteria bacterium]